ncbi:hypothetical protein KCU78_g5843, partial [Aureobasidium melanogenum]
MSEPFSDKEKFSMDTALQSSRPAMPFIEEDDDVGTKIKTEDANQKRSREEDDARDVKKPKEMYYDEELAYGGEPLQKYNGETPYDFRVHERLPEHEVNSSYHRRNIDFHGKILTAPLLAELNKHLDRDDELKNFHQNFKNKRIFSKPGDIRFAVIGPTGAGKSTFLNIANSAGSLSTESAGSRSETQVALIFSNAIHENFEIIVTMLHESTIRNMLGQFLKEIMTYVLTPVSDRGLEDIKELAQDAAESVKVLKGLIPSLKSELKNLKEAEKFLQNSPMVNHDDTSKLLDHFIGLIQQRAQENGVSWKDREKKDTASTAEEVNRKIATFCEPGGLASIVSEINIRFKSPLLAQGIELVDLPGLNDRNTTMRNAATQVLKRCHKIIVVVEMKRCTSESNVKEMVNLAIDLKGIENVILVIRDRELFEERSMDVDSPEARALEDLQQDLDDAIDERKELRSKDLTNTIAYEDQTRKIEELEQDLYLTRLVVRDQMFSEIFANDYQDLTGKRLQIMTVASLAYKKHMAGTATSLKPYLPVDGTHIPLFREWLCKEHGDSEVQSFKGYIQILRTWTQQLLIWIDPHKLPSRDAVIGIFDGQIPMALREEKKDLEEVQKTIRTDLEQLFVTRWPQHVEKQLEKYRSLNGGTVGACIKKRGVHKPSRQAEIRMNRDFLEDLRKDLKHSLKSLIEAIKVASSAAIEKVRGNIRDLKSRMEQSGRAAGMDLNTILGLFESEEMACILDIEAYCREYEARVQAAEVYSTNDRVIISKTDKSPAVQSAFVDKMDVIFDQCFKAFPPKYKGKGKLTHIRLKFLEDALLAKFGPYWIMGEELCRKLERARQKWAKAVEERVKRMRSELKKFLSRSFEGKVMSAGEKRMIAPSLRAVANQVISDIDNMLSKYKSPVFKVQQTGSEDDLFMAE